MTTPSLSAQIVSGQIDTAIAAQLFTNRIQDTDAMMCPLWTGTDLAGRPVCRDSFYTKRAGCNSALDRIEVEDALRPRYAEFLLDARGIVGVGADYGSNAQRGVVKGPTEESVARRRRGINLQGGNFGVILPSEYAGGKNSNRLDLEAANAFQGQPTTMTHVQAQQMAMASQNRRNAQNLSRGYQIQENYGEDSMMQYPGGLLPNPGNQTGLIPRHQTGLNPAHQTGLNPRHQTGLNPRHQTGLNPRHQTGLNPRHQTGLTPRHQTGLNPENPAYQDYWLNSMCVPPVDERTTWNNYVQVKDICNHSGQRF